MHKQPTGIHSRLDLAISPLSWGPEISLYSSLRLRAGTWSFLKGNMDRHSTWQLDMASECLHQYSFKIRMNYSFIIDCSSLAMFVPSLATIPLLCFFDSQTRTAKTREKTSGHGLRHALHHVLHQALDTRRLTWNAFRNIARPSFCFLRRSVQDSAEGLRDSKPALPSPEQEVSARARVMKKNMTYHENSPCFIMAIILWAHGDCRWRSILWVKQAMPLW